MRILLDHNVNPRYARLLPGHEVNHTQNMGWGELLNGALIAVAEAEGFSLMITADKNLQYQQNLGSRNISILILNSPRITWAHIEPLAPKVREAIKDLSPGSFIVISSNA